MLEALKRFFGIFPSALSTDTSHCEHRERRANGAIDRSDTTVNRAREAIDRMADIYDQERESP